MRKGKLFTFVGEYYSQADEIAQRPFFGSGGQELTRLTREVGINLKDCSLTNVFNLRPPNNDLRSFCVSKAAAVHSFSGERPKLLEQFPEYPWPQAYDFPPILGAGGFLHPAYLGHLATLRRHILDNNPKLVIGMGNVATWALLRATGIGKLRGYSFPLTFLPGGPRVIPTYTPTSCLQQYSHRPVVVADLRKAVRLASGGTSLHSSLQLAGHIRTLWIEPSLEDLETWRSKFVSVASQRVSIDIETFGGTITCIGFGTERSAICVPFWLRSHEGSSADLDGRSYWTSPGEEALALSWVRSLLESPNPKVLQNAQYDLQYLWRTWGMVPKGTIHDTMLMAHALQPEMEKGLGFLGSAYTDSPAWKHLRKVSDQRAKMEKKDA